MRAVKELNRQQLESLCGEIRARILQVVSANGGHLSSSLGAVEMIVAMHVVFDAATDPFIFDVSHQAYAHKLLTDRWESFDTLRQFGGISGFTKPHESAHDYFVAGHSSTSISLAVGAAKAIALEKSGRIPVALIGDGAMSSGMVYEAMNELGERKYPMVIIINDNEMSIARPIGAVSRLLSRTMATPVYQKTKALIDSLIGSNETFQYLAKRFEVSLRLITPGILFEEFGLEYIGPVNGHDLGELIATFKQARDMQKPVVVHTQTTKGKGYQFAEGTHEHWHGVGPFNIDSGEPLKKPGGKSTTQIYSDALFELAKNDEKIVGITAAMPSGTGLDKLIAAFPDRFWDVAIAEEHAVTSCAALAKEGFKPFCTIYSTFLQRGFDQIVHDTAISSQPVKFAVDRAGIVGEDGETHQGTFDVAFLRLIPNMVLFAPRDEQSLINAVSFAAALELPCAFRYPRGSFAPHEAVISKPFELGKAEWLKEGEKLLMVGYGNGAAKALAVHALMQGEGINCGVLDLRFVKPIDTDALVFAAERYETFAVLSDSSVSGGVSSAMLEALSGVQKSVTSVGAGVKSVKIVSFELPDQFLQHGTTAQSEESLGLTVPQIAQRLKDDARR